jgi:hypothetical protein
MNRNKDFRMFRHEKPRYWTLTTFVRNVFSGILLYIIFEETQSFCISLFVFIVLLHMESQLYMNKIFSYSLRRAVLISEDQRRRILNDLDRVENDIEQNLKRNETAAEAE